MSTHSVSALPAPGRRPTVLLVEDSRLIRKWTTDVLESAGYNVVESDNMWVRDLVKTHVPDLILMDIHLGTATSGLFAAQALKKTVASTIPLVFYSASRNADDLAKDVVACGADGFIPKDQKTDALLANVARFVNRQVCT